MDIWRLTPPEALGITLINPKDVMGIPLDVLAEQGGTSELHARLQGNLALAGLSESPQIARATNLAMAVTAFRKRILGDESTHCLLVASDVLETAQITNPATVAGAILHDVPEDHPRDAVRYLTGETIMDQAEARERCFKLLARITFRQTARITRDLTNPILGPDDDKNLVYLDSAVNLRKRKLDTQAIKTLDFNRNTGDLGRMALRYAIPRHIKYTPCYREHIGLLENRKSMIPESVRKDLIEVFTERESQALSLLASLKLVA